MFFCGLVSLPPSDTLTVCFFSTFKAWLSEIHEYAQKDVVIMLLGNKVSKASFFALHKKMTRITVPQSSFKTLLSHLDSRESIKAGERIGCAAYELSLNSNSRFFWGCMCSFVDTHSKCAHLKRTPPQHTHIKPDCLFVTRHYRMVMTRRATELIYISLQASIT